MTWLRSVKWFRVVVALGASLLALSIASWHLGPEPTLARASEREEAAREVALEEGRDFRLSRPRGDFVAGNAVIEPAAEEVKVAAAAAGILVEVVAREGETVKQGDVLVRLDDRLAKSALALAQAEVKAAAAEVRRLRRGNRSEDIAAAKAQVERLRAVAAISEDLYRRAAELAAGGAITKQELVASKGRADADRFGAREAEARWDALAKGFRGELIEGALAQLAAAEARAGEAEVTLEQRLVRAPSSGEVLVVKYRVGELYSPGEGEPLVILGDTSSLRARVDVYERDVGQLNVGARVVVRAPAYPEVDFVGEVSSIGRRMGRKNVRADDPAELEDTKILEVLIDLRSTERLIVGQRVIAYISTAAGNEPSARLE